jgi:hypothetical protein
LMAAMMGSHTGVTLSLLKLRLKWTPPGSRRHWRALSV